jgi:glutamyl-tRNA reductase
MNYVLAGMSHRTAPIDVREKFTQTAHVDRTMLRKALSLDAVREALVLSTCNRVEVYCVCEHFHQASDIVSEVFDSPAMEDGANVRDFLYVKTGDEAVKHLFRVAASLDALVVGENQIVGQVKDAFESAREEQALGQHLNRLFHRALHVAKRIKTETEVGRGTVSVGSAAVMLTRKIFDTLQDRDVLLVGAGEMGETVARSLSSGEKTRVHIVNRTADKALALEERGLGFTKPWQDLAALMGVADIVITALSESVAELSLESFKAVMHERKNRTLFIIDLGVPRTVPPSVAALDNVYLYNVDDLKNIVEEGRLGRNDHIVTAQNIIDEEVGLFYKMSPESGAMPAIASLAQKIEDVRQSELKRTLPRLKNLSLEDTQAIDKMTQAIVGQILKDPILALKGQGAQVETGFLSVFKQLFRLDDEG